MTDPESGSRDVPVVVVTGKALADPDWQRGVEHARAVVEKPINRAMLLGIVAHLAAAGRGGSGS